MVPLNKRIPTCVIRSTNINNIIGKKHLVRITDWPDDVHHPNGQLLQTIGDENDFNTDNLALLYEAGVWIVAVILVVVGDTHTPNSSFHVTFDRTCSYGHFDKHQCSLYTFKSNLMSFSSLSILY